MFRFFLLFATFSDKTEFEKWAEINFKHELNSVQISFLNYFSYSDVKISGSLDLFIDSASDFMLLRFILAVQDRALLWYSPEPCWPSDFKYIINDA